MADLELIRQAIAEHGCNDPDSVRPRCHACGRLWPCLVEQMADLVDLAVLGARVLEAWVDPANQSNDSLGFAMICAISDSELAPGRTYATPQIAATVAALAQEEIG